MQPGCSLLSVMRKRSFLNLRPAQGVTGDIICTEGAIIRPSSSRWKDRIPLVGFKNVPSGGRYPGLEAEVEIAPAV
jgi:hypothetical protein